MPNNKRAHRGNDYLEKFVWPMEGGLSLVIYTGSDPSSGTKPHNVVYFSGEEVDIKVGHTELEQVSKLS